MNKPGIYLGKEGKAFGPFSEAEFQKMMRDGSSAQYRWIWDANTKGWKPLDQPPPTINPSATPLSESQTAKDSTRSHSSEALDWQKIEAICFDHQHLITGKLQRVTETGCEFVVDSSEPPKLVCGNEVHLNLVAPSHQKSQQITVTMISLELTEKSWSYLIRWNQSPRF